MIKLYRREETARRITSNSDKTLMAHERRTGSALRETPTVNVPMDY